MFAFPNLVLIFQIVYASTCTNQLLVIEMSSQSTYLIFQNVNDSLIWF